MQEAFTFKNFHVDTLPLRENKKEHSIISLALILLLIGLAVSVILSIIALLVFHMDTCKVTSILIICFMILLCVILFLQWKGFFYQEYLPLLI